MASQSISDCTDGEVTQFKNCMSRAGYDPKVVRAINTSPGNALAQFMYDMLMTRPEFTLIHGVFTKTADVLANFKARCAEKGIDFGRFSWLKGYENPREFTDDPEVVVVLDANFDTLQNTFESAWAWTVDGQDCGWRWKGTVSDAEHLCLLSDDRPAGAKGDGPDFRPWTLSWRRIKLDTNVGKPPVEVRHPTTSPGCALLWMSAEHPARVKATDYKTRFGYFLAGLKCLAPDQGAFTHVPRSSFRCVLRKVELDSRPAGLSSYYLAVPSFEE